MGEWLLGLWDKFAGRDGAQGNAKEEEDEEDEEEDEEEENW